VSRTAGSGSGSGRRASRKTRTAPWTDFHLGLFGHLGAGLVWGKLVAGLAARVPQPSEKALRDLRRRVGVAPLKRLFDVLAGPLAQPSTPGVRYRRWRTVAFDGCGSLSVPDHERNRSWLGRTERRYGPTGYPRLMLMTLCETGTRGLIAAVFGPASKGETDYAHDLVGHLTSDMLLLADRAFDSHCASSHTNTLGSSKAPRSIRSNSIACDGGRPCSPKAWKSSCRRSRVEGRARNWIRLSRPEARFRCCHRPVSPDRSPNPAYPSPSTGLSTIPLVGLVVRLSARGWGSCRPGSGTG
jgi:hypothetical protein